MKHYRVHTVEDLKSHFADEFNNTADLLRKCNEPSQFETIDHNGELLKIESIRDLKNFLQSQIDAFQAAIEEMES